MESPFKFTRTVVWCGQTPIPLTVQFRSQWCGALRGGQRWWRLWWREWTLLDRGGRAPLQQTSSHSRWQPCLRHHVSSKMMNWNNKTCIWKFGHFYTAKERAQEAISSPSSLESFLPCPWSPGSLWGLGWARGGHQAENYPPKPASMNHPHPMARPPTFLAPRPSPKKTRYCHCVSSCTSYIIG